MEVLDTIKALTSPTLTEREVIIYLLIESGMTSRDLANRLGISHESVRGTHKDAKAKIDKLSEAGMYSSDIKT